MAANLQTITQALDTLRPEDFDYRTHGNPGPGRLDAICQDIHALRNPASAFPALFALTERLSGSDLLELPSIIRTMEKYEGQYEELLVESVRRKPTVLSLCMVNRLRNDTSSEEDRWLNLIEFAAWHPDASEGVREWARYLLGVQQGE